MKLIDNLQRRFYNSSAFKGLLNDYSKVNDLKILTDEEFASRIDKVVADQLTKRQTYDTSTPIMPYRNGMARMVNMQDNADRKADSAIPFSYLRRASIAYPIARACINRRIRQLTALEWDVTTREDIEDEEQYSEQIKVVKSWLKRPFGGRSRFSQLINLIVDDVLTLDATTFEIRRMRNGKFINLVPVDPATIVLRLDESGATPEPPEVAYAQKINGQLVAQFTTNELLYEKMSTRSYSPYGLAPMESLILQIESALRGAMYNLAYFKESNVPEGFITLPEDETLTLDQIKEWQMWFDQIMSGNQYTLRRLKVLPGGASYTQSKKPEDMSFERFEMWLLQQTCAMFEVQPQDIGITYEVNKATANTQQDIGFEKGAKPLANFVKEALDDLVERETGNDVLQFIWVNMNPVNRKEDAEVAKIEIEMGALAVDEYRIEQGREPIGLGQYIKTGTGPLLVKSFLENPTASTQNQTTTDQQNNGDTANDGSMDESNTSDTEEQDTIKTWKRRIINDIKNNRALKVDFDDNDKINPYVYKMIKDGLEYVDTVEQARLLFDNFLDKDARQSIKLLELTNDYKNL